jgi:glycosyltransferase involved in cell wall biosynthesis
VNRFPLLSVIVPVYNGDLYLESTIHSILSFSADFSVECIVVNDGSTDNTLEILEGFNGQIRVFSQENGGESSAVNVGFQAAKGEFVLVVSADDPICTPKLFQNVVEFFEKNPKAVAWYPDWNMIDSRGRKIKSVLLPEFSFRDLFENNRVLPGPGTWIRKKVALRIGGRNPKWIYVGDYDFWLRLAMEGEIVHRPGLLAQWRKHFASTSISHRGELMAKERVEVIDSFIENYESELSGFSKSLAKANSRYYAARLGFFSRDVEARKLAFTAIRLNYKVIRISRLHEFAFMLSFPLSKQLIDVFRKVS